MNWIYYLLEANLYLTVFYALYYLTLRNETYYQLNRFYLLFTSALSFCIPLLQLGFLKPRPETPVPMPATLQHAIMVTLTEPVKQVGWDLPAYFIAAYLSVCSILTIHLAFKIYSLIRLSNQNKITVNNSYRLIEIERGTSAFSFFNYLFISADQPQKQTVINHELIHIQQKHSWDILYLQVLKIVNWFNPVVYLLQHSIKEQHEFIADRETLVQEENASAYASFLINNAYGINQSVLANTFFNKSLLKKRIIMLHQKPSGNLARLKYLAALPICVGLLCMSTLGFSKTYALIDLMPQKADTVVLVPPPPPEQPDLKHVVKFRPPTPPFGSTTKKGYRYAESGYLIDGKWYSSVIIQQSKNLQKEYWKNKVSTADVKMLRDKYGYTFPSMPRHVKLPPPPPQKPKVIDVALLPPPPAIRPIPAIAPAPAVRPIPATAPRPAVAPAPAASLVSPVNKVINIAPKQTPEEVIMNYPDTSQANLKGENIKPVSQLFIINGTPYRVKTYLRQGEHVYVSGQNSMVYYTPGDVYAKSQWGVHADSGVVVLSGKPIISVR